MGSSIDEFILEWATERWEGCEGGPDLEDVELERNASEVALPLPPPLSLILPLPFSSPSLYQMPGDEQLTVFYHKVSACLGPNAKDPDITD